MLSVEIEARDDLVGMVRALCAQAARQAGFSEEEVDDVRVAVTELVSNAVEAHQRNHCVEPVRVDISADSEFRVTVSDRGNGFELESVRRADPLDGEGGLGLVIAEALSKELLVEQRPGGGTAVTLLIARR